MSDFLGLGQIFGAGINLAGTAMTNATNAQTAQNQINFQQSALDQTENFANQQTLEGQQFNTNQLNEVQQYNSQQAQFQDAFQSAMVDKQSGINQASVQQAQAFSEAMSNTAYQRSVADMKKAGLNPILGVASGGASSPTGQVLGAAAPSGASGSSGTTGASLIGPGGAPQGARYEAQSLGSSALSGAQAITNMQSAQADIENKNAQTTKTAADVGNTLADTDNKTKLGKSIDANTLQTMSTTLLNSAKTATEGVQQDTLRKQGEQLAAAAAELQTRMGLDSASAAAALAAGRSSDANASSAKANADYLAAKTKSLNAVGESGGYFGDIMRTIYPILKNSMPTPGNAPSPRDTGPAATYPSPATD